MNTSHLSGSEVSDFGAPEEFPHSRYWLVLILWAFALSGGWLVSVCGGAK